jgi:hypothetical protein
VHLDGIVVSDFAGAAELVPAGLRGFRDGEACRTELIAASGFGKTVCLCGLGMPAARWLHAWAAPRVALAGHSHKKEPACHHVLAYLGCVTSIVGFADPEQIIAVQHIRVLACRAHVCCTASSLAGVHGVCPTGDSGNCDIQLMYCIIRCRGT